MQRGLGSFAFVGFAAVVVFVADHDAIELTQTGASGDEVTADDVFFHAFEVVGLSGDGGFVEHLGGFLEGRCGHERLGLQGGAGDTLKNLRGGGGDGVAHDYGTKVAALELGDLLAEFAGGDDHTLLHGFAVAGVDHDFLAPDAIVLFGEIVFVDDLLLEETGVAGLVDLHLAHHLTNDDFEVLVVDFHTLEAIDVLHLVDDVLLHGGGTLDGEDVARCDATVGEGSTGAHEVVFLYEDLLGEGNKVFLDLAELGGNDDFAVAALDGAHGDLAVDFGNDCGVGGVAGFEEFGDTGQTTGDVAGRTDNAGDLDDDVTGLEHLLIFDHEVTVDGEVVGAEGVAVFVDDVCTGHYATFLGLDDDAFTQTGGFVFFDTVGATFLDVFEDNATADFSNDDGIEGVPLGHEGALGEALAFADEELRAVGDVLRGEDDAGVLVDEASFGETGNDDLAGGAVFADYVDGAEFVELYAAIVFGDDGGVGGCTTGDTTGVEGTEGELGTGFTDGLGGNDADGFALLYHLGGGEVAAVALLADAVLGFAGEDGTDFDFLDAGIFDGGGDGFGDFFAGVDEDVSVFGVGDVVHGNATEDALGEGADDFVAVLECGADEATEGAAVFFVDDDIVRNVDETAGEVSGVGGLQGRIGETLTGTVGGDEVLEHGHTFLKVGEDGVLNGGAGVGTGFLGLGHETTHTGELGDLVGATTGSGVEHHEDRVETLVGFGHLLHEGGLDVAVDLGPGVDDLVVSLVVGDETHTVVAHDLLYALITGLDDIGLFGGDDDIVEVEGQTAFVGLEVTEVLDAIEEFAGARHTDGLDDAGDDVAERFLGDDGVDEAYFGRDDFVDDDATDGGLDEVTNGESVFVEVVDEHLDGGVHGDTLLIVGDDGFFGSVEGEAGSLGAGTELGDVVETEHHVLGGDGDGGAVGGVEDVVALEHQHLRL